MSEASNAKQDTAPAWLGLEFFETALRSGEADPNLKVTHCEITRATAPGDNYLSVMYRALVHVMRGSHTEKRSLILKVEPEGETMKKVLIDYKIFDLEVWMLKEVVPAMHQLLEEAMPGKFTPFAPRFIYYHTGPPATVFVMEDLKEQGFEMTERTAGLDLDHCMFVIRSLARFHAASVALYHRNPEILQPFMEPLNVKMTEVEFKDFFTSSLRTLSEQMKGWSDKMKRASEKVLKLSENSSLLWTEARARDDKEFNVLIHGDLWINNMLFRYSQNNRQVEDVRFVDYQFNYWTSPGVDLQLFLCTSPCMHLLEDQQTFIREYHKTLVETLTLLGYGHLNPTFEEINKQVDKRGLFGTLIVFSIRNSVLHPRDEIPDFNDILKDEGKMTYGKLYRESLEIQIPFLERNGWF